MVVSYQELPGSPSETWDSKGIHATRKFLCNWSDRVTFISEILGSSYVHGRQVAACYPGIKGVVATRVSTIPFAKDMVQQDFGAGIATDLQSYKSFAVVTVNYEFVDPSMCEPDSGGTYMTYQLGQGCNGVQLPGRGLEWEITGDSPGDTNTQECKEPDLLAIRRVPITEHRLTWHTVIRPPLPAIRHCIGTSNQNTFFGADPGTLLFDGCTMQRDFVLSGELDNVKKTWELNYVFRERRILDADGELIGGWGFAYKSTKDPDDDTDKIGWFELKERATHRRMIPRTSFTPLLVQDPSYVDMPNIDKVVV